MPKKICIWFTAETEVKPFKKKVKKKYREVLLHLSKCLKITEYLLAEYLLEFSQRFTDFRPQEQEFAIFQGDLYLWLGKSSNTGAPAVRVYWLEVSVETKVWMKCGWLLLKAAIMSYTEFIPFYHNHCWTFP